MAVNPKLQKSGKLRGLDLRAPVDPVASPQPPRQEGLERETGFEPATLSLEG
jgi:hypothetical protein